MSILMQTENQSFQSIMGNGSKYKVPRFQRDYSWTEEQWEDLWADVETLQEEKQHYMGYVVLQTGVGERELIIDGQQRLTTLSIIVLSAIKILDALDGGQRFITTNHGQVIKTNDGKAIIANLTRADEIRRLYIGTVDPVSLTTYNKLELNRNNDVTFRRLSALENPPTRKVKRTNALIKKSFDFFCEKLQGKEGKSIAAFIETMSKGLIFTKISVDNEINAYKVFETLNARGVQLSTPDLLKNYLFSVISKDDNISEEEMSDLDERWEGIVYQLGKQDFSHFLRTDWNSQYKTVSKNALFKAIRTKIHSRPLAYDYLKRLTKRAEVYAALFIPSDELWRSDAYKDCAKKIAFFDLFNIKQPFNVLLAAYDKFDGKEFGRLMQYLLVLSARYNIICNRSAKAQESVYNEIALKISSGEYKRASHVKNAREFKELYPSDDDFIVMFSNKRMPRMQMTKKIRYLLAEIEHHLSKRAVETEGVTEVSIEHILPENPDKKWIETFGDGWEDAINRLGNMTLLSMSDNKSAGRRSFNQKKDIYKKSGFYLAEKIATYGEWNNDSLSAYQQQLAKAASKSWKMDYA